MKKNNDITYIVITFLIVYLLGAGAGWMLAHVKLRHDFDMLNRDIIEWHVTHKKIDV